MSSGSYRRVERRPGDERTIVLVDIQNIAGKYRINADDVHRIRVAILHAAPMAQTIVACHRANLAVVAFGWNGARVLPSRRSVPEKLAEIIHEESVHKRFDHVVLATGDGALALCVAQLATTDVRVTVLVGRGALSARLRLACHHTVSLPLIDAAPDLESTLEQRSVRA